jgi:DNA-binding NarL/FixJ family response regulator
MLVFGFREVLRHAGLGTEPAMIAPPKLLEALRQEKACLVIVDVRGLTSLAGLDEIRAAAPESRIVLCGSSVTPEMLQAAMQAGIHGVISTQLPLEEAALAITQICNGEWAFRFESQTPRAGRLPIPKLDAPQPFMSSDEFDTSWMFGCPA